MIVETISIEHAQALMVALDTGGDLNDECDRLCISRKWASLFALFNPNYADFQMWMHGDFCDIPETTDANKETT